MDNGFFRDITGDSWRGQTTSYYREDGTLDPEKSTHTMVKMTAQNVDTFKPHIVIETGKSVLPSIDTYVRVKSNYVAIPEYPKKLVQKRAEAAVESTTSIEIDPTKPKAVNWSKFEELFEKRFKELKIEMGLEKDDEPSKCKIQKTEETEKTETENTECVPEVIRTDQVLVEPVAPICIVVKEIDDFVPSPKTASPVVGPPLRKSIPRAAKKKAAGKNTNGKKKRHSKK